MSLTARASYIHGIRADDVILPGDSGDIEKAVEVIVNVCRVWEEKEGSS